jgi:hypothetical protein
MSFEVDTREFVKAIEFVERASGKDAADILNNAGRNFVIGGRGVVGVIRRTPRADLNRINAIPYPVLVSVVLRRLGPGLDRAAINEAVRSERNRRKRAIGYTAGPGWHKAAVAMGGRGVRTQAGFPRSKAAQGSGTKANAARLVAELVNKAPAASTIGGEAVKQALANVTRDLIAYGNRKIQQRFDSATR